MKPEQKPSVSLKPVRTREDCFDWLTEEEVGAEVWSAFRSAVRYYQQHDFELDCATFDHGSPGHGFIPGTVVDKFDNEPWCSREVFFGDLLRFVVWRLQALAERKGVDWALDAQPDMLTLPPACKTASDVLKHGHWGPYLAGEVRTFKSKREMEAWMKSQAQQKKAPASVRSTPEAVTNVKRGNADGTHCRP